MGYFVIVNKRLENQSIKTKPAKKKNVFETELLVAKIRFQSHSIFLFFILVVCG